MPHDSAPIATPSTSGIPPAPGRRRRSGADEEIVLHWQLGPLTRCRLAFGGLVVHLRQLARRNRTAALTALMVVLAAIAIGGARRAGIGDSLAPLIAFVTRSVEAAGDPTPHVAQAQPVVPDAPAATTLATLQVVVLDETRTEPAAPGPTMVGSLDPTEGLDPSALPGADSGPSRSERERPAAQPAVRGRPTGRQGEVVSGSGSSRNWTATFFDKQ